MAIDLAKHRKDASSFGSLLKECRKHRGISQLDLAADMEVSTRHLSFLETGRSMPSEEMVLRLCDQLDLPYEARDMLLTAAGYHRTYRSSKPSDDEMAVFHEIAAWNIRRHMPYPAFVLDSCWRITDMNRVATKLFALRGMAKGDSLLDYVSNVEAMKAKYENWEEILRYMLMTFRAKSAEGTASDLFDKAITKIEQAAPVQVTAPFNPMSTIGSPRLKLGDRTVRYRVVRTMFPTSTNAWLRELTIVQYFPFDDACRDFFLTLAEEVDD